MAKKAKARKAKGTGDVLRHTWSQTLTALASAEAEIEKQVGILLKRNRISTKDAQALVRSLGTRLEAERKRAVKELDSRLKSVQHRVQKERRAATRFVHEAVQSALASLNIPSRHEVTELTRKVDELSKKIGSVRRRR